MAQEKTVQVSVEELAELRALQTASANKKNKSQGRSKARQELIKRHKPEYDALVTQFGG